MYDYLLAPDWDTGGLYHGDHDPALVHRGDHTHLLRQHRAHAAAIAHGSLGIKPIGKLLFRRIADARTMYTAYEQLRQHGGKAPGPDHLRLADLEVPEAWSMCRSLADDVAGGFYMPGPERLALVPKGEGKPPRQLLIQNTGDRIVAKAAALILEPVVDSTFYPFSLGFRSRRGPHEALATALALARLETRTVWVSDDVATAFDAMPFARFLQRCRQLFPDDVVAFIQRIAGTGRRRGIRQGSPDSPLFWNIFADFFIDRPFLISDAPGYLLRYADDLLILCRTLEDAQAAYTKLAHIARIAGTPLKGEGEVIVDLATGQPVVWLGFQIRRQGRDLAVHVAERAWKRLGEHLEQAHYEPSAPLQANQIILGWLGYQGPSYVDENRRDVLGRVREVALAHGFDEIPTRRAMDDYWQRAYARWKRVARHESDTLPHRLDRVAQMKPKVVAHAG